jgi:hypothetical protein
VDDRRFCRLPQSWRAGGTYTLYVLVSDSVNWQLIVNRQTRQGDHIYNNRLDLGRVDMKMDNPKAPVEKLRWLITTTRNTW